MPVSTSATTPCGGGCGAVVDRPADANAGRMVSRAAAVATRAGRRGGTPRRTRLRGRRNAAWLIDGEFERAVVDPAALQQDHVADVVLVEPPRRAVALLRELV